MKNAEVFGILGLLCLAACGGYQIYLYLMHGMWFGVSLINVGSWMFPNSEWLNWPQTWIGVHKVLNFFNAGIVVAAIFFFLAFANE